MAAALEDLTRNLEHHRESLRVLLSEWQHQECDLLLAFQQGLMQGKDLRCTATVSKEVVLATPFVMYESNGSIPERGTMGGSENLADCGRFRTPPKPRVGATTSLSSRMDSLVSFEHSGSVVVQKLKCCMAAVTSLFCTCCNPIHKHIHHHHWRKPKNFFARVVGSPLFELLCCMAIVANAVVMTLSADYSIDNPGGRPDPTLQALEAGFAIFYTVELLIRIAALHSYFFFGRQWSWNLMDTMLVLTAWVDIWDSLVDNSTANLSILRLARLAKLVKMLRLVRVMRLFRELRLLTSAIIGSVKAMIWSLVLVLLVAFMFAICILQSVSLTDEPLHDVLDGTFYEYWGSVSTAMLTLFMASTGGESWRYPAEPLWDVGSFFYCVFLIYICFFLFVVVNIVTSIFLQTMVETVEKDTTQVVRDHMERMKQRIAELEEIFSMIDDTGSGKITQAQFLDHVRKPTLRAFLAKYGIDVTDARLFYDILSKRGTEAVSAENFVEGCTLMRGPARSMDLIGLSFVQRDSFASVWKHLRRCEGRLDTMAAERGPASPPPPRGQKFSL